MPIRVERQEQIVLIIRFQQQRTKIPSSRFLLRELWVGFALKSLDPTYEITYDWLDLRPETNFSRDTCFFWRGGGADRSNKQKSQLQVKDKYITIDI